MLLKNATVYNEVFEPIRADVAIEGETIAAIGDVTASGEAYDLTGCTVLPGFIDMHIHGYLGKDVCDGEEESIRTISEGIVKNGVTGWIKSVL